MSIAENLQRILEELPKSVDLAVVSKNNSTPRVREVVEAGAKIIAENRLQEAKKKFRELDEIAGDFHNLWLKTEKHLIGHLQTNKAKDAVKLFDVVQSLDSLKLAVILNDEAEKIDKVLGVLIQVNISKEEAKFGVYPENLKNFYKDVKKFRYLKVGGLMTITKNYDDPALKKADFLKMKSLFDDFYSYAEIPSPILSMGMSADYKLAAECGSNMVRVGSAIFQ